MPPPLDRAEVANWHLRLPMATMERMSASSPEKKRESHLVSIDRAGSGVAGRVTGEGRGFGWLANMIVGVIGALIGGFLFGQLGVNTSGDIGALLEPRPWARSSFCSC